MSEIRCNRCGRIIVFGDMHNKEDYVLIQKEWGYFSRKDGRKYTLRMCEDCYDRLVNECVIPPRIDDVTEYAGSPNRRDIYEIGNIINNIVPQIA